MAMTLAACNTSGDAFESFAEHFGKTSSFARAELDGRQVLLVSHEVFGTDEGEGLEAVATSIYALDSEGSIVSLGSIRSQGTLYPVSTYDGKLMVAGHQFVTMYDIRGEEPDLYIFRHEEGDCDSPELKEMFGIFEQGQPLSFKSSL